MPSACSISLLRRRAFFGEDGGRAWPEAVADSEGQSLVDFVAVLPLDALHVDGEESHFLGDREPGAEAGVKEFVLAHLVVVEKVRTAGRNRQGDTAMCPLPCSVQADVPARSEEGAKLDVQIVPVVRDTMDLLDEGVGVARLRVGSGYPWIQALTDAQTDQRLLEVTTICGVPSRVTVADRRDVPDKRRKGERSLERLKMQPDPQIRHTAMPLAIVDCESRSAAMTRWPLVARVYVRERGRHRPPISDAVGAEKRERPCLDVDAAVRLRRCVPRGTPMREIGNVVVDQGGIKHALVGQPRLTERGGRQQCCRQNQKATRHPHLPPRRLAFSLVSVPRTSEASQHRVATNSVNSDQL